MSLRALRNLATFLVVATASSAAYAAETAAKPETIAGSGIPWTVVVAALACLLVRIVVFTESKNKLLVYNIAISGIAVLGSVVYTIEYVTGLAAAFGVGLSMGAGAVGLVEFAKSKLLTSIKDGIVKGLTASTPDRA
ncbi:hypothetical protein SAMN05192583_0063 [Sphingomonas gellani]|uniref:Uncharacterized protein n=1 Tax=Sphingomonas gellani TaxID=1166340 RepID=A0A1H7Y4R3_9SPHN|nr:hypothetical protein [Sphingomonas gellani]SEM40327.1 hypothetical protein SAMN05192583_0063 [Sphingomonas gellani]